VEAAICLAEKARRTARARSVAALFIITFFFLVPGFRWSLRVRLKEQVVHRELARGTRTALDLLWMNGLTVSKTVHNSGIETDNMQLKKKEILLW
jgi:hypothetical protein